MKPDDIPDDIWALAAYEGMAYKAKRREIVARAIMAERERCEAEIARLRGALKPFSDYCDELNGFLDNHNQPLPDDSGPGWVYVKVGDFRRARAALISPAPSS